MPYIWLEDVKNTSKNRMTRKESNAELFPIEREKIIRRSK